ncbi:hypothetical protein [Streptomyces sp. NPDC014623]|uniref:hypothetical protein n=1 Tax=Streptomyces sp. NPDC014623 TaxID=3364875 RepID=UPI003702005B
MVPPGAEPGSRRAGPEPLPARQESPQDRASPAAAAPELGEPYEAGRDSGFLDARPAARDAFMTTPRWNAVAIGAAGGATQGPSAP